MSDEKEKQGLIQIYTGDGKGKTTAALGLALRAAGWGMKTVIVQFMKNGKNCGELKALADIPQISVFSYGNELILWPQDVSFDDVLLAKEALSKARESMSEDIDILILDEINNALEFDLLQEEEVLELLRDKPAHLEIIATGREASAAMIAAADLVTEMKALKHPYQRGVRARKGIEY